MLDESKKLHMRCIFVEKPGIVVDQICATPFGVFPVRLIDPAFDCGPCCVGQSGRSERQVFKYASVEDEHIAGG
jgi:hypothetical protein